MTMKAPLRVPPFNITILIGLTLIPILYAEQIEIPLKKLVCDEWYGIYDKGEKIGRIHRKCHPFVEDGEEYFLIEKEMKMFFLVDKKNSYGDNSD